MSFQEQNFPIGSQLCITHIKVINKQMVVVDNYASFGDDSQLSQFNEEFGTSQPL